MKLIVGLGNIGKEYENTRHNVGFMAIDRIAEKYGAVWHEEKKFKGILAEAKISGERVILLKPTTFMNLSGDSLILVKQFYKIDINDILVINDDLDQSVGNIRYRAKGSAGGHNGLKSIIANLGTEEFQRIRIGIDRSKVISVVDWVLGHFPSEDMKVLDSVFPKVIEGVELFVSGLDSNRLSNKINAK